MTSLEYMEKRLNKNRLNYERESARGVPEEMLHSIKMKISYYQDAVNALKEKGSE